MGRRLGAIEMRKMRSSTKLVLGALTLLTLFAIPHLIDDFLYGIPEEFGISNQIAQVLAGIFSVFLVLTFVGVGREARPGLVAAAFLGGFLALAVTLKHFPIMVKPGPYWSGWFSELLILGVFGSGILLLIVSAIALRGRS
jgi:hypothetical protein